MYHLWALETLKELIFCMVLLPLQRGFGGERVQGGLKLSERHHERGGTSVDPLKKWICIKQKSRHRLWDCRNKHWDIFRGLVLGRGHRKLGYIDRVGQAQGTVQQCYVWSEQGTWWKQHFTKPSLGELGLSIRFNIITHMHISLHGVIERPSQMALKAYTRRKAFLKEN